MTPFGYALRERIAADGAISVEAYMEACNDHYYATRDPLGASGDFTTAPEVSQMFGEMVGAALADCWARAGSPVEAVYVELGPGRGTLAKDALRVMRGAGFAGSVHLVETSPSLREVQANAVPEANWHDGIDTLLKVPLLLAANEFFDALPIRQFAGGIERMVTIDADGLMFDRAFDRDGEVVEDSPARNAVAAAIAGHLAQHGGVALIVDYGHERSAPGDTLQAVRGHAFAPILANPGEQDLTAHVDFEALGSAARGAGAAVSRLVRQGDWLRRLGIEVRATAIARDNPDRVAEVNGVLDRLTGEAQMGALFKVVALHHPAWPIPAGLE